MNYNIATVIVTYNRKFLLKKCLDSILCQTVIPNKIIIIDNNSNDGTYDFLVHNQYLINNKIEYIKLNENIGGAGGFNYGIEYAYSKGYEWIWIMDDDVSPEKNCLEELIDASKKFDSLIYVPLRVSKQDEKINIEEYACIEFDLNKIKTNAVTIKEKYDDIKIMPYYLDIKTMAFEGPLISRELIKKIGFPDKSYFIFYDDTDYAIRASMYTSIKLVSRAILYRNNIINDISKKTNQISWREYYIIRNEILFNKKYSKNYIKVYLKPLYIMLKYIIKLILNYKDKSNKLKIKAVFDGYFNKSGKIIDPATFNRS